MPWMVDRRLVEIETRLAFLEDSLQALNHAMYRQQEQINQLEITCRLLLARVQNLAADQEGSKSLQEKPPHY